MPDKPVDTRRGHFEPYPAATPILVATAGFDVTQIADSHTCVNGASSLALTCLGVVLL